MEILSGIFEGRTTGTPVSMIIRNKDAQSSAYDAIRDTPRPGHADYTYQAKYGLRDHRGGGRASARETAGRVAGGAVARKLLAASGIDVIGYVTELGGIRAAIPYFAPADLRAAAESNPVRCPDQDAAARMIQAVEEARTQGDSVGGVVEVLAVGVPPGLGEPVFDKLDADLAKALMSIGAVKAVEIGAGLESARMRGSEMNDPLLFRDGKVELRTNHAGGILGGISTGGPIICTNCRQAHAFDLQAAEHCESRARARRRRSRSKAGMIHPSLRASFPWPRPWSPWCWPITFSARGRRGSRFYIPSAEEVYSCARSFVASSPWRKLNR